MQAKTKTKRHLVGAVSLSALALGMLIAADASAQATTGIAATRHNLGSSNRNTDGTTNNSDTDVRAGDIYTNGTDEICVFCHTPHASATTSTVNAPLWNKAVAAATAYTVYSSGTMQGTASLAGGAMSLACLSCHDGTQAMDNMINAPSTGTPSSANYTAAGKSRYATSTWWAGTDQAETTGNTLLGALNASTYMELGTDLSNDHPVGMPYCGGSQTSAGSNAGCNDLDFVGASANAATNGFVVGSTGTEKQKMRLYGGTVGTATVECGSCHDPHNSTNTGFLRIPNSGSAVCLTCHAK